eukprot:TRINITY_DN14229_c0_g1_i1.p1 TRINITY_DN14229_c0_g1~~TRINITY_DN14229_c0_g1_i1.p1  ORF type:complete len:160 (-),score=9.90 TRINITY_DN14229_c0_g1_i1:563-1042(-)
MYYLLFLNGNRHKKKHYKTTPPFVYCAPVVTINEAARYLFHVKKHQSVPLFAFAGGPNLHSSGRRKEGTPRPVVPNAPFRSLPRGFDCSGLYLLPTRRGSALCFPLPSSRLTPVVVVFTPFPPVLTDSSSRDPLRISSACVKTCCNTNTLSEGGPERWS